MSIPWMSIAASALVSVLMLGAVCWATEGEDTTIEKVLVTGTRYPMTESAYRDAYRLAKDIHDVTEGTIGVGVRTTRNYGHGTDLPLQAWADSGEISQELEVKGGDTIILPVNPEFGGKEAKLFINRETGEIRATRIVLFPTAEKSTLTLKRIRQTLKHFNAAARLVLPSLLGFLAPSNASFSICQSSSGGLVRVIAPSGDISVLPMDAKAKDDGDQKVWCHHFHGQDAGADDAKVTVPIDAQLLLLDE